MTRTASQPIVVAFGLALAALALGCAAMVRGTHQQIPLSTVPPGALVQSGSGSCETPCMLKLERSQPHSLTVSKSGYQEGTVHLKSSLNEGWLVADILLWFPFNFLFMGADCDLTPASVDLTLEPLKTGSLSPPLKPLVLRFQITRQSSGYASVDVRERGNN